MSSLEDVDLSDCRQQIIPYAAHGLHGSATSPYQRSACLRAWQLEEIYRHRRQLELLTGCLLQQIACAHPDPPTPA
jgi:hypothetical protein